MFCFDENDYYSENYPYTYRNRRLSTESRYSSYGVVKNRKEVRPLTDKDFQQTAIYKVCLIFLKYTFNFYYSLILDQIAI